jgi:tetratricopeptide (TPR) repeat protein
MKKISIFLLPLIILLLSNAGYSQLTFEKHVIESDLNAATALIKMGDYVRAEKFLQSILGIYGNDPRILTLQKQLYRNSKAYDKLESEIRKELEANTQNPSLLIELGEVRFLQNDTRGADSLWNRAMQVGGKDAGVYYTLADTKLRYGLNDDAIKVFRAGRNNINDPTLFSMELAGIYETIKDYPNAVSEYLTQVIDSPDKLSFVLSRVRGMLEDDDNPGEIIAAIERKIQEAPGRPELYEVLGDVYIKQNRMDKALECFKVIGTKQNDDGQSLVRFAYRAFDSKAYTTAISAIDDYLKTTKNGLLKDSACLIKAKSQMASGQQREALAEFKNLNDKALDYRIRDEAGFTAGIIYAREWNLCDSALMLWTSISKLGKDQTFLTKARQEMAICYLRNDDIVKAKEALQLVVSDKPPDFNTEQAAFLLAEIALYEGRLGDATAGFNSLVKQYPQGDYSNDALTRLSAIATIKGDSTSEIYRKFALGLKARDLDNNLKAAEILSDTIFAGSPIFEQTLYFAANSYALSGQREKAIAGYKKYIENIKDGLYTDRVYLAMGDIYGQEPATYPLAKSMYNKILESYPDSPSVEMARKQLAALNTPGKIG